MKTISQLVEFFKSEGYDVIDGSYSPELAIVGGKNILEAETNEISFLCGKYREQVLELLDHAKSPLIIIDKEIFSVISKKKVKQFLIISDDPKATIVDCLSTFYYQPTIKGIHKSVLIDEGAQIGKNNYIGPNVIIEGNVLIGDNCQIEPNVFIRSGTRIGNNVVIKAGAIIGGKGFGFIQQSDNTWKNFPHFGKVIIEDNVEIGSNTCIDRGSLSDTIIKKGVKVDNLVHIAHNVFIGQDSLIIANAMIGGSVKIGQNTWVSPSTAIKNGLTIGENSVIGMGAIVIKNVDASTTVVGNPASLLMKKK